MKTKKLNRKQRKLLDYFAGLALTGLITLDGYDASMADLIANDAYSIAMAMLGQRSKVRRRK